LSTIERGSSRGQALVIFTFALVAILAVAALVFDVGQDLLDRRDTQNAADAAALAGARYLTDAGCKGTWTVGACPRSVAAARELAQSNGFADGVGDVSVEVKIPPGPESVFRNYPGHIEVRITEQRPTFFGGVIGISQRIVSSIGTAANLKDFSVAASFIALDEHVCQAGKVNGNGVVDVAGAVQVNSDCSNGALFAAGTNITLHAPACNVVGDFKANAKSDVMCPTLGSVTEGAPPMPDPLASLKGPYWGSVAYPAAIQVVAGTGTPAVGCPDGQPEATTTGSTLATPQTCRLGEKGTVYRIFPGLYPGGLDLSGKNPPMTVLMEPGIYYIAGGGIRINGSGVNVYTVDAGTSTPGGGVLIYNTEDPVYHDQCLAGTAPGQACIGALSIGGSGLGDLHFEPFQYDPYKNLLIYQERSVTPQPDIQIDGSSKTIFAAGTIYGPKAEVKITGNGENITTQVISNTWQIGGNGNMTVTYDADAFVKLNAIGLVE
jgi:hypothetical protein